MDKVVYALCAATSALCAWLLFRGYTRTKLRLLLWSAICFTVLCAANVLLYVDYILYPDMSLAALRIGFTLVGALVLLFGLIWETI